MRIALQQDLAEGRWRDRSPRREGDQTRVIKMKPGESDYLISFNMAPPSFRAAEMVMTHTGQSLYREVVSVEQADALAYIDLLHQGESALIARIRSAGE